MFIRSRRTLRPVARFMIAVYLLALGGPVWANPEGGTVVAGQATISQSGSTLSVQQATDKAIVNWQSFSNAAGETVRFQQPGAGAAILNRVTGANGSVINGALEANGRVLLINPNGVIFGKTATVNVGGLTASTLDTSNEDFMAGRGNFQRVAGKPAAGVVNQGRINAAAGGHVALIGGFVNNEGTITAPGGKVALAAGDRATLALDQAALVTVGAVAVPGDVVLDAAGASDLARQAVNNSNIVAAGSVRTEGGKIVLGAAEGVAVNQGTVDVSGAQGGSARVVSSQATVAMPGSSVMANGEAGGEVRLLSKGTTVFTRTSRIEAKGGNGSGGFVEVSGDRKVVANGAVATTAASGRTGTYLIDPTSITIVNGSRAPQDLDVNASDGSVLAACACGAPGNTIAEGVLEGLAACTNIVLEATNTITLCDIDCGAADQLVLPNNSSFTLRTTGGGGAIVFTDPTNTIRTQGTGSIVICSSGSVTIGNLTTANRSIQVLGGGNISTRTLNAGTGNVQVVAAAGSLINGNPAGVNALGANVCLQANGGGNIGSSGNPYVIGATTLTTTAANAFLLATGNVVLNTETMGAGGVFSLGANGTITDVGPATSITADAVGLFTQAAAFDIGSLSNPINMSQSGVTGRVLLSIADTSGTGVGAANAFLRFNQGVQLGTTVPATAQVIVANNLDIVAAGNVTTGLTARDVTANSLKIRCATGIGSLGAAINTNVSILSTSTLAGGSVFVNEVDDVLVQNSTVFGNFTLNSGGNVTVDVVGSVNASIAAAGNILSGNSAPFASNLGTICLTLAAGGNIGAAGNPVRFGANSGGTCVIASAGGDIFLAAPASIGGSRLRHLLAGNRVDFTNNRCDVGVSLVCAPGGFRIVSSRGILDINGPTNNFTVLSPVSVTQNFLIAFSTVGTATDALEATINQGTLTVHADQACRAGVSVNIAGIVSPSNALIVEGTPPGRVLFNSVDNVAVNNVVQNVASSTVQLVQDRQVSQDNIGDQRRAADPAVQNRFDRPRFSGSVMGDQLVTFVQRNHSGDDVEVVDVRSGRTKKDDSADEKESGEEAGFEVAGDFEDAEVVQFGDAPRDDGRADTAAGSRGTPAGDDRDAGLARGDRGANDGKADVATGSRSDSVAAAGRNTTTGESAPTEGASTAATGAKDTGAEGRAEVVAGAGGATDRGSAVGDGTQLALLPGGRGDSTGDTSGQASRGGNGPGDASPGAGQAKGQSNQGGNGPGGGNQRADRGNQGADRGNQGDAAGNQGGSAGNQGGGQADQSGSGSAGASQGQGRGDQGERGAGDGGSRGAGQADVPGNQGDSAGTQGGQGNQGGNVAGGGNQGEGRGNPGERGAGEGGGGRGGGRGDQGAGGGEANGQGNQGGNGPGGGNQGEGRGNQGEGRGNQGERGGGEGGGGRGGGRGDQGAGGGDQGGGEANVQGNQGGNGPGGGNQDQGRGNQGEGRGNPGERGAGEGGGGRGGGRGDQGAGGGDQGGGQANGQGNQGGNGPGGGNQGQGRGNQGEGRGNPGERGAGEGGGGRGGGRGDQGAGGGDQGGGQANGQGNRVGSGAGGGNQGQGRGNQGNEGANDRGNDGGGRGSGRGTGPGDQALDLAGDLANGGLPGNAAAQVSDAAAVLASGGGSARSKQIAASKLEAAADAIAASGRKDPQANQALAAIKQLKDNITGAKGPQGQGGGGGGGNNVRLALPPNAVAGKSSAMPPGGLVAARTTAARTDSTSGASQGSAASGVRTAGAGTGQAPARAEVRVTASGGSRRDSIGVGKLGGSAPGGGRLGVSTRSGNRAGGRLGTNAATRIAPDKTGESSDESRLRKAR